MNAELLMPSGSRAWPEEVITCWRRFSFVLWRVPEGDISAAYSAETFPKIKVFSHEGGLFTNCGGHSSGPVAAAADCYRGELFKLRTKVMFTADDGNVDEWRHLLRAMYGDGGWFARHANYGLFLNEDSRIPKSDNEREALRLELAGQLLTHSKQEMSALLDRTVRTFTNTQLDLSL